MKPVLCDMPVGSRIARELQNSDFADCYQFDDLWPDKNAMEIYLTLVTRTPDWMNALMAMRNQAVRLVGLKHLGNLSAAVNRKPAHAYHVGDGVGIFSRREVHEDEVILFDDDKHLSPGAFVHGHRRAGSQPDRAAHAVAIGP